MPKGAQYHQSPANHQTKGNFGLSDDTYDKILNSKKNKSSNVYSEPDHDSSSTPNQKSDAAKILELLQSVDLGQLETALTAIKTANEQNPNNNDDDEYKFYKDKTLVYEDQDAFIYQRPDRKRKTWYFRIYDNKNKKPKAKKTAKKRKKK